jgi:hypothetical protein
VCEAAEAFGAAAVSLHLSIGGEDQKQIFEKSAGRRRADAFVARYSLLAERHSDDLVELTWIDGRGAVDRDTEIAIELLCDHASEAVERIRSGEVRFAKVVGLR